jgi:uncharacterized damage-inducible protein DinB
MHRALPVDGVGLTLAAMAELVENFSHLARYNQHQTHHRGQLTALMTQAGLAYGRTGFIDSYRAKMVE